MELKIIQEIVTLLTHTPTADNCQPFSFCWRQQRLCIFHDSGIARHGLNPNNYASRISFGSLMEALEIAASNYGFRVQLDTRALDGLTQSAGKHLCLKVKFLPASIAPDPLCKWIPMRCTDRRLYPITGFDPEVLKEIKNDRKLARLCGFYWAYESTPSLLDYFQRCDFLMWAFEENSQRTLNWIRFSEEELRKAQNGMNAKNLGMGRLDVFGLKLLRKSNSLFQMASKTTGPLMTRQLLTKQIKNSAALGCATIAETSIDSLISLGRGFYRMWLILTKNGCALHPLSVGTLPPLFAEIRGDMSDVPTVLVPTFKNFKNLLRAEFSIPETEVPAWTFRVGKPEPLPREWHSPRRSLESILSVEG